MSPTLVNKFAETGSQLHTDDPIVLAHYFNVSGYFHWLATEYNKTTNTCFGYTYEIEANGYSGVWCEFSLDELAKLMHPNPEMPIPDVELDTFFPDDRKFSEICPKEFHSWREYQKMKEWLAIEKGSLSVEYER